LKTKTLDFDELQLTYHVLGNRDNPVVFVCNAPGMSGKFWINILGRLHDDYFLICPEYRGFPGTDLALTEETARFELLVDDARQVLAAEQVTEYTCLNWCLGGKIALALAQESSPRMREMVGMNMGFKRSDLANKGSFSQLLWSLLQKIETDEVSIERVLRIMSGVGALPTHDFLEDAESDNSAALDLYDLLESESNFASLAFYMIDTKLGLRNYLQLYRAFSREDCLARLANVELPVHLFIGGQDRIVQYDDADYKLFESRPNVFSSVYESGSHFMLIEDGERMGRDILQVLRTNVH